MKNYNRQKIKQLTIKKLGWKRIAKNVQRFGWVLYDATEHTTITEETTYEGRISGDTLYINPRTNRKSYTRVWLTFYRALVVSSNVKTLEFFYNVIYFLRKIFAFCLPILWIGTLIMWITAGTGNFAEYFYGFLRLAIGCSVSWILGIILEGVLSRIAGLALKKRINPYNEPTRLVAQTQSGKNNGIITLCDSLGNYKKYKYIESANYQGNLYVELKDVKDGRAIMCKVMQDARGKEIYDMVMEENIISAVLSEFKRQ